MADNVLEQRVCFRGCDNPVVGEVTPKINNPSFQGVYIPPVPYCRKCQRAAERQILKDWANCDLTGYNHIKISPEEKSTR